MNTLIEVKNKILDDEFYTMGEFKYLTPYQNSRFYEIEKERIEENLYNTHSADRVYFLWLLEFYIFHVEYATYALFKKNNIDEARQHIAISNKYASIIIGEGSKACNCLDNGSPFIIVNKATFMLATQLLSNENDSHTIIGKHLIDSLNGNNCIIKKGYAKSTISWFVLKLFGLNSEHEIKLHKLLQPKAVTPYDNVLKHWDSVDLVDVERNIELLCESHLVQSSLDYEQSLEEELESLAYKELFSPSLYLFPFEILYWLKLRELKGVENPKQYSHPLMNTPIAKMFLNIKEPLANPKNLPYAKEILIKLKEKCPDIEIPNWL